MVWSPGSRKRGPTEHTTRPTHDNEATTSHFWTTGSRMHGIQASHRIVVIITGKMEQKTEDEQSLQETHGN